MHDTMVSPEDKLPALVVPRLRDGHAEAAALLEAAVPHLNHLCHADPLQVECGPHRPVDSRLAAHACRCSKQLRHTPAGQRRF